MNMNMNMNMDTHAQLMHVIRDVLIEAKNGRANAESRENEHPGQDDDQRSNNKQDGKRSSSG